MKQRCVAIIILLTLFSGIVCAQKKDDKIKFNYGIKAGFQAVTYNSTKFTIDGYKFDENTIQSNKVSYTINPFVRLTKNKFYIQTEAAFGVTRHHFIFEDLEAGEFATNTPEYNLTTYCFQVPILFGYNFIDQEYYGMSFFTGPRTKFIFTSKSDQEFHNFKYEELEEKLKTPNYYWELGLGVRIYNVFFDITYDWGFIYNETTITNKTTGAEFKSKRSDSVLCFTVGFIF